MVQVSIWQAGGPRALLSARLYKFARVVGILVYGLFDKQCLPCLKQNCRRSYGPSRHEWAVHLAPAECPLKSDITKIHIDDIFDVLGHHKLEVGSKLTSITKALHSTNAQRSGLVALDAAGRFLSKLPCN